MGDKSVKLFDCSSCENNDNGCCMKRLLTLAMTAKIIAWLETNKIDLEGIDYAESDWPEEEPGECNSISSLELEEDDPYHAAIRLPGFSENQAPSATDQYFLPENIDDSMIGESDTDYQSMPKFEQNLPGAGNAQNLAENKDLYRLQWTLRTTRLKMRDKRINATKTYMMTQVDQNVFKNTKFCDQKTYENSEVLQIFEEIYDDTRNPALDIKKNDSQETTAQYDRFESTEKEFNLDTDLYDDVQISNIMCKSHETYCHHVNESTEESSDNEDIYDDIKIAIRDF